MLATGPGDEAACMLLPTWLLEPRRRKQLTKLTTNRNTRCIVAYVHGLETANEGRLIRVVLGHDRTVCWFCRCLFWTAWEPMQSS
jgi:hypothetical protein